MITKERDMKGKDWAGTASFLLAVLVVAVMAPSAAAQEKDFCAVYITGIGCPHCAKADPFVLSDMLDEYPNLVIIEYEIYQEQVNAPLIYIYDQALGSGLGIPLLILGNGQSLAGDIPILQGAVAAINTTGASGCPLPDGSAVSFGNLSLAGLPQKPKIWTRDRILIPGQGADESLKSLLTEENLTELLLEGDFTFDDDRSVALSGSGIKFDHAVVTGSTSFKWNGECPQIEENGDGFCDNETTNTSGSPGAIEELTVVKLLSLAAVDAVNPCALAVLTLMLIAILTYNPKKKRNILLAGIAFTASVFVMYMLYGLVIIRFFQFVQAVTAFRLVLYQVLGLAAIALGLLNLRDFVRYKPGGMMTEMPMFMRPMMKRIVAGITSPWGAFLVGAFVTVFLLPCTIGPYIIAGGILSVFEIIQTIPWLLLYNAVFVLPMVAITLVVYAGVREVEDVSGWKDRNIRYLHGLSGAIILLLGIMMVAGWL
jgi:hypothetical protein